MISLDPNENAANIHEGDLTESASDRELLSHFVAGEESAFAEIVQRHAGLVIHVCQRILRHPTDAEDAFQATFLVLARKARSIRWQDSIAGWLHQTARRTALKLRATSVRRRAVEGQFEQLRAPFSTKVAMNPATEAADRELDETLHEELARLPVRFREVILLSQFEGLTRDEVAAHLGVTVATVKDRLERGREQLRSRMIRRGFTLSSVALAGCLVPATAQAATLTTLITTTSQAAGTFASSSLATGISPAAATLAQGVLKYMGFEKFKYATIWTISFLTAGGIVYGMLRDESTRFEKGLRGQVVAVYAGKPATITIALEEFGTMLNLDIAAQAKLWTAFEAGTLTDLKEGQFVSLRLGDDHRTVNEIHVQGPLREVSIQSVASPTKIVVVGEDDDDDDSSGGRPMEVELAPDAILRIGGLPATRNDLKPGMHVPLEFGRDGKLVNAIEAEAAENTLIETDLLDVDSQLNLLTIGSEENDDGAPVRKSLKIPAEVIITLDGKPAKLADLKPGTSLKLRLADDGQTVRVVQAVSPEAEDNEITEEGDE
jgi:RNA polymerase sigma factor (sigma-70 family)